MLAIAVLLIAIARPAAGQTETFLQYYFQGWDTAGSVAGWTPNTAFNTVTQVSTGGNPGGYLESNSGGSNAGAIDRISTRLEGYFTGAGVNLISFDLRVIAGTFSQLSLRLRYKDSTFNGWRKPLNIEGTSGQSFAIRIDPNLSDNDAREEGWIQDDDRATFAQTLSEVFTTEIRVEAASADFRLGIDNF